MSEARRYVNVIPTARLKKENIPDLAADTVRCRLCPKGFASDVALRNHAWIEHIDAYITGDPAAWTFIEEHQIKIEISEDGENEEAFYEVEPGNITMLASKDVSYIIVKEENEGSDDIEKKSTNVVKKKKKEKVVTKKRKEAVPITGPFECLESSTAVADGVCHQIFFSCCEYSIHHRDEHAKRRKGLRCQVCEKPLACTGEENLAPFSCEVCGLGFQNNDELTAHTAIAHVKLKPFECTICHKRFTQQGGLAQHMRMHTGDRPYPCTFCPKSFTQKSGLDQHLRTHTKIKPYRCIVCNKNFSQSIHLRQHMRTHTNVSPFQCGICDKRFKQSGHLNFHLKNHNPATMSEEQRAQYKELIGAINMNQMLEGVQPGPEVEGAEIQVHTAELIGQCEPVVILEESQAAYDISGAEHQMSQVNRCG